MKSSDHSGGRRCCCFLHLSHGVWSIAHGGGGGVVGGGQRQRRPVRRHGDLLLLAALQAGRLGVQVSLWKQRERLQVTWTQTNFTFEGFISKTDSKLKNWLQVQQNLLQWFSVSLRVIVLAHSYLYQAQLKLSLERWILNDL